MPSYKHILVPTDGSALSLKAAKEATALAKDLKAKITAVYVIAPYMPTLDAEGAIGMRHGYDTIASTPPRKKKPLPKKEIERRAKQRATQKPTRSAGGTRREVS